MNSKYKLLKVDAMNNIILGIIKLIFSTALFLIAPVAAMADNEELASEQVAPQEDTDNLAADQAPLPLPLPPLPPLSFGLGISITTVKQTCEQDVVKGGSKKGGTTTGTAGINIGTGAMGPVTASVSQTKVCNQSSTTTSSAKGGK